MNELLTLTLISVKAIGTLNTVWRSQVLNSLILLRNWSFWNRFCDYNVRHSNIIVFTCIFVILLQRVYIFKEKPSTGNLNCARSEVFSNCTFSSHLLLQWLRNQFLVMYSVKLNTVEEHHEEACHAQNSYLQLTNQGHSSVPKLLAAG